MQMVKRQTKAEVAGKHVKSSHDESLESLLTEALVTVRLRRPGFECGTSRE